MAYAFDSHFVCFFKRLTPTEWEGTKRIVRVTKDCADLTVDILQKTDYGEQMPYR